MAEFKPSLFCSFNLSEEEYESGATFQPYQIMVLRNHLSDFAHKKLTLTFDKLHDTASIQEEAEVQGKIAILQFLIEESNRIQQAAKERAALEAAASKDLNS